MLLAAVLVLATQFASAAGSSQPAPAEISTSSQTTEGIRLLNTAADAMGSAALRKGMKSAVITGTIASPANPSVPIGQFSAKLLGKHHLVESTLGDHHTRVSTKGSQIASTSAGKSKTAHASGILEVSSNIFPLFDHWARFDDGKFPVSLGTDQTIEGVPCHEVIVSVPANFAIMGRAVVDISVFINSKTGLLRAVEYGATETAVYNPALRSRAVYDDFKVMDGLNVPSTITRYLNKTPISVLHIEALDTHQQLVESDLSL